MGLWVEGSKLHEIGHTGDLVLYIPNLETLVLDDTLYQVVLSIDPGTYIPFQEDPHGALSVPEPKVGRKVMERFMTASDNRLRSPGDLLNLFWCSEQMGWFKHPPKRRKS